MSAVPALAGNRLTGTLRGSGRVVAAAAGAVVVFGAFLLSRGANPVAVYVEMVRSTLLNPQSLGEVLIKATPLVLAALAVAVPARAGLVNVGGEGQIVVGAVSAAGVALALDASTPGAAVLVLMLVAGAAGGAAWGGLAGVLRQRLGVNEAISTLLLNYVAIDLMLFLIYDPWKDPNGSGQPATRPLAVAARLPLLADSRVHGGILIAAGATVAVWWLFTRTSWGFRLQVTGGNPEAARRAGLPVHALLLSAMLAGGALAGLAGVAHFAGAELQLRPGMTLNLGYIAFLASWLARHRPVRVALAAALLAAIAIAGDSLQIDSGLPAASVNVLMGLVLVAVMGVGRASARRSAG